MEEENEYLKASNREGEAESFYPKIMSQKLKIKGGALNTTATLLFCVALFIGALFATPWFHVSIFSGASFRKTLGSTTSQVSEHNTYELNCNAGNSTQICAANCSKLVHVYNNDTEECPEYFRWIYEDLRPWKKTGITKEIVESGIPKANFRIVVLDGKVYFGKYMGVFQTRDIFTVWGIIQLLKFYPGKIPDLDFMFECGDKPMIPRKDYVGANASVPPPVFHYCGDNESLDLVFPDWSFWGWPEINIKSWMPLKKELKQGNRRTKWKKRRPYAYWKGNLWVGGNRGELLKCNVTNKQDWNARIYHVSWDDESKKGYKNTNLADQCTHRYKIYIEGVSWSVSEKYILACDSMTLLIQPQYYDFFTRGLQPLVHYWPINTNSMCNSIKFAVDWGNSHTKKAQEIGRGGSDFIHEGLKMKNVYDYMFHLLNEYAKLMNYKPTVPPGAIEVCSETMACDEPLELNKKFKIESMVKNPSDSSPCSLPPPYSRKDLHAIKDTRESILENVEKWESSKNPRKVKF